MNQEVKMHETMRVGILLAFVGGFLDVYTYLLRGGVFANAQTGNMVLLTLQISQGHFVQALYYLVPIIAFFMGDYSVIWRWLISVKLSSNHC